MTHQIRPQQRTAYATERYFVDPRTFIEIEFYKDGEAHRVWPYIGHASVEVYKETKFITDGKTHFVVPGVFETQAAARKAARTSCCGSTILVGM